MGIMSFVTAVQGLEKALSAANLEKQLADNVAVKAAVIAKAKEVQEFWKSIAPVSSGPPHPLSKDSTYYDEPGDYQRSIKVKYEQKPSGEFSAKVYTRDPKRFWIEYGSSKMPEYACAARTVEHFNGHSSGTKGAGSVSA